MEFEWDSQKAVKNFRKHQVSFAEAATVFNDDLSLTVPDPDYSSLVDDLRPEYDLKDLLKVGERGKYAARYRTGTNLILLVPDVAQAFPDAAAVNEALRLVIRLGELQRRPKSAG